MLFSDLRYDFVRTWFIALEAMDFEKFEAIYRELEREGRSVIAASAISPREITVRRALDMRYVGQEHSVTVDIPQEYFDRKDRAAMKTSFDAVHAQRYGTSAPAEPAEIVSLRTTVTGIVEKPGIERIAAGHAEPPASARSGSRSAFFEVVGFVDTPTYTRAGLLAGNVIQGPALIEEHASTTVVMPGERLEVDVIGNLVISIAGAKR
jgi:N-methylhydantoinase A